MYYTFLNSAFVPSPKSLFSRLNKYDLFNLFTSPVFPDVCSNFSLSSWQQFGRGVCLDVLWDVMLWVSALRMPAKVLHIHDMSSLPSILLTQHRVAFSSFATTHASKRWLLSGLWSAPFPQRWLLGRYSPLSAWAFNFAVPRLVLPTCPYWIFWYWFPTISPMYQDRFEF